ncbi:MAG: protein-disulfide reductase DsbD domain-containing protein [Thermoanaerobaculia bacterium]
MMEKSVLPKLALTAAILLGTLASPGASPAAVGPWVKNEQARVRLVGAGNELGLEFELAAGWHVYWKNPGDAGYAPRLDFSATPALRNATLLFPAPHRIDLPGGLVSYGYETHVLYPVAVELAAGGDPVIPVTARLDYLVCSDQCIPYTATLELSLPRSPRAADGESARLLAAARSALPVELAKLEGAPVVTLSVRSARASAGGRTERTLEVLVAGGSLHAAAVEIFFESHPLFTLDRPVMTAGREGLRFRVPLHVLNETRPLPAATTFAWTLTGFETPVPAGADGAAATAGTDGTLAITGTAEVDLGASLPAGDTTSVFRGVPRIGLFVVACVGVALFLLHRFRRPS